MSLPSGWVEKVSRETGKTYFLNTLTNASQWDKPEEDAKDGVRASHLLVKHVESRRPSSWREETITRTKDQALEILKGSQTSLISIILTLCTSNIVFQEKEN